MFKRSMVSVSPLQTGAVLRRQRVVKAQVRPGLVPRVLETAPLSSTSAVCTIRKKTTYNVSKKLAFAALAATSEHQMLKAKEGLGLLQKVVDRYMGLRTLKALKRESDILKLDILAAVPPISEFLKDNKLIALKHMLSKFTHRNWVNLHKSKAFELEALAYELPVLLARLRVAETVHTISATRARSKKFHHRIDRWANVNQRNVKIGYRIKYQIQNEISSAEYHQ